MQQYTLLNAQVASQHDKSAPGTGTAPPHNLACTRAPAQQTTILPAIRTRNISAWQIIISEEFVFLFFFKKERAVPVPRTRAEIHQLI